MRIYTSFWSNPELADLDAQIVSISRGSPRWPLPFRYRRLRELAPNDEAWNTETREEFEAAYLAQLGTLGIDRILEDLERIAGERAAVLLCFEKPGDPYCHRWTLSRWLEEQIGTFIPELMPGMLEKRPDSPQPGLFD